ncbi:putative mediator of RNA polymerase II transcription subunit 26 isoform X2 [Mya arenaria]|uniref:putative mediator of RNA polymerase II transcription subunit 26 isoform X2 n=1 Tax=Mya arenaria TaxID=6604 RepID=UPI0022E1635A|nr:putative mediator of RNA polymerase II transcription subunit 26 isoform X2 [Mya arenaria]
MLGGAYSSQFKHMERQHVDTLKTLAENEKSDALARARKLSIETNKRRRALAVKRKTEAEREEKRRQQILSKRREKQQEATEKFQRSHFPSRPGSGTSSVSNRWSPRRANTQLEDALKLVRGNSGSVRSSSAKSRTSHAQHGHRSPSYYRQNSDPLSKPYFNKYAHPSINSSGQEDLHNKSLRNLNNSRTLFEQQLETYQQSLLQQQQKSLRDFNQQVMQEIENEDVLNVEQNGLGGEMGRSESLSSVDSLEENGSNDTVRESCDLEGYMGQKQNSGVNGVSGNNSNCYINGTRNVSFADNDKSSIRTVTNVNTSSYQNNNSHGSQNIDSYNAQVQALLKSSQKPSEQQKEQFYLQRQKEIHQQLADQEQKKQQEQRALEKQQKQQLLLQQQYEKQQQEQLQLEKRRQMLEQQKQQQENIKKQEENPRPKVEVKAWTTPSPHPPSQASVMGTQPTLVTNASPYSGRSTNTNMTVPLYENLSSPNNTTSVSSKSTVVSEPYTLTGNGAYNSNDNSNVVKNVRADRVQPSALQSDYSSAQERSVSFLETVTNGLPVKPEQSKATVVNAVTSVGYASRATSLPQNSSTISAPQRTVQQMSTKPSSAAQQLSPKPSTAQATKITPTPPATTVTTKPPPNPANYGNSYGAAFAAKQNQQQQKSSSVSSQQKPNETVCSTKSDSSSSTRLTMTTGTVPLSWGDQSATKVPYMMGPSTAVNGDDIADTDSVSTICDEKEPEPKEVKSILKRPPSGKKGGILKKSGSTGNMRDIRDSLEITRVHLQTSAEEQEQRMLREKEKRNKSATTPTKKNVRFDDMCYYDEPEHYSSDDKIFVRRDDAGSEKPTRPVSAVTPKSSRVDSKPPRATSATVRTSTIPRAKTQVVRPQGTAHIITQSTLNLDPTGGNEKMTIVNGNFMEKVPAMARANQTAVTVAPVTVYNTSTSYMKPEPPQKGSYAVTSIIMPKGDSAPFLYPNGKQVMTSQGPAPACSMNGPTQTSAGSKHEGAVYDDNGLRIDRTPTDDEINFLWDKLRTCLSRNSTATPDKGQTPVGPDGNQTGPRQAAPVAHTYIDGNTLGQFNSLNRVAQPPHTNNTNNPAIRRQNSLDNAAAANTYTRRYGLLQQRKQQPNPQSLKSRQASPQQGYTVYQAPVQSHAEPQTTGNPFQNGADVSESLAGFLAAEQLANQSVSESHIHQAIDEAQTRQQAVIATKPKMKSALSVEEQRLMQSLDRLNEQLQVTEGQIPVNGTTNQPVPTQQQQQEQQQRQHVVHRSSFLNEDGKVSGFKGHAPLTAQRRIIETGNHKARLRITSAALKRNVHRQQ